MQHGHHVTIIASPVSYLTGQVVPGARGRWVIRESLFVRPGDPEALAEAVLTYYRDPACAGVMVRVPAPTLPPTSTDVSRH